MADSERDVLAEALRDAERGWEALVAASSRGRNITRDHYIAETPGPVGEPFDEPLATPWRDPPPGTRGSE